jgi:hypothetical protein
LVGFLFGVLVFLGAGFFATGFFSDLAGLALGNGNSAGFSTL